MGKENGRGKSRRRNISQARKFLNREGKKLCSAALCVSLLFGSVLNTTVAANKDTDDDGYEFELSRASLYQALQDAVLNGDTVDEDMEFRGSAAEEYSEMFAPSGSLYELKPEIEDNDGKVQLRVFAKLDQDIDLDSEYEAAGTEEIMFLLTNRSDEAQKAVIYMDDKYTEEIEVAPGKAIAVQEDETSQGPAGGGAGNGGGSSSGGSAAGGETPADTETTGPADEGGQAPDNGGAPTESQPEETTGTENEDDVTTPGGATDSTEGNETVTDGNGETGDSADDKTDDSATSDNDNSTSVEDGDNENGGNGGDAENTGDPNTDSDNAGNENQSGGQTGAGEGGSENTGNTENGGGSTENSDGGNSSTGGDSTTSDGGSGSNGGDSSSDSSDSGNSGSDSATTTAAISFHKASWVAAPVATDSDMPVATSSDLATNSDLEKLIDGELYEAVRLRENGAVAFVTTLDDLGVMDGWGPIVFGQKFEADIDGFRVRAIARKGVLRDAEEMRVEQLTAEEHPEKYNEAVTALEQAGTQYEGMMALDITFRDSEGVEVEPNGEVQVSIELKEGTLPEDADPSTVVVQHLKETGDSVEVEKVADAAEDTNGIVALAEELTDTDEIEVSDEAQAVAAFSVESFSTFTITWNTGSLGKTLNIELHYVSEGNDLLAQGKIDTSDLNQSITEGRLIYFKDYIGEPTEGSLEYLGAHYGKVDGSEVVSFKAIESGKWPNKSYKIEFYNESGQCVATIENGDWEWAKTANIYLVFGPGETVDPPQPSENMLTKSKTVTYDEKTGAYSLNLSVSGSKGTDTIQAKVDVLFIVDTSTSMNDEMGTWPNKDTKLAFAKNAISTAITNINENSNIDARYNVIEFGSKSYLLNSSWSTSINTNGIKLAQEHFNNSQYGGTNYEDAITKGIQQLQSCRDGAERYVIFLSDGLPTFRNSNITANEKKYSADGKRYDWYGTGQGDTYNPEAVYPNEDERNVISCLNTAKTAITEMNCDGFFAVGLGGNFEKALQELVNAVPAENKLNPITASDGDALKNAFDKIAGEIISYLCTNVTVIDPLSEYVKPAEADPKLTITVDKGNGNSQTGVGSVSLVKTDNNAATTITASYSDGEITLNFPEDYQLEENWTYTVTMGIEATEKAYQTYRDNAEKSITELYPNTGDKGTGYHAEQPGFYSNKYTDTEKATVTYTYKGSSKTEEFAKPVIQIHPGTLVITKEIAGNLTSAEKTALVNALSFEVELKWHDDDLKDKTDTKTLSLKDVTPDQNGKYTFTIENLSPNTQYSITENGADVTGYTRATTYQQGTGTPVSLTTDPVTGTISKGTTETVAFVNTYSKQDVELKVTKTVAGDMGETNRSFNFVLTLEKNNTEYTEDLTVKDQSSLEYKDNRKGYPFELSHGETVAITIPYGYEWEIKETPVFGYDTEIKVDGVITAEAKGTAEKNTEVVFTNTKDSSKIPLTGIFTDKLPYLLMFSIAMICTAGAMFNSSVRRRHGREEE
ncbi:DUF7604 domain-containing protein [Lachnoclostridium sp. An14]|uniref:DUF7604 domain-containing protein n=1 Tax=Lachnoclostridium sp. An14 TaxID=1965562 RepID=UPI0013A67B05|nr:VWA domain-containing protein [Lachnoclostridium sp. An14]